MNKDEFIRALSDLGIKLNTKQLSQLDEFYRLLKEENKKYNLPRRYRQRRPNKSKRVYKRILRKRHIVKMVDMLFLIF